MKEMETDETDNSQLEDDKIDEHSCPVCGKVLSSLQNVYRHLETVHTEEGHVWESVQKKRPSRNRLKSLQISQLSRMQGNASRIKDGKIQMSIVSQIIL